MRKNPPGISILILKLAIILLTCSCDIAPFQQDNAATTFVSAPLEVESQFLITPSGEIIYSATNSFAYRLYSQRNGEISQLSGFPKNSFYPFLVGKSVAALSDKNGNEEFYSTNAELQSIIGGQPIEKIFSFNNGKLLIIKPKFENKILIIDFNSKSKRVLLDGVRQLYAACLLENGVVVINYDEKLVAIDRIGTIIELAVSETGHGKMMPFVSGNEVFFASNSDFEHQAIFKVDFSKRPHSSEIVYRTNNDLKVPKLKGGELYFVEVSRSEYLLKRLNLTTRKVQTLTKKGVVYNFEFDKERVIFSYSDMTTPKSIVSYNLGSGMISNLTTKSINLNIAYNYIAPTPDRSPAYILSKVGKQKPKGVILYFHPGLHSDFSPRWDTILMNLCNNGYILVCPNFPMSTGLGKTFYNLNIEDAVQDLMGWKKYILKNYDLPLYYLSLSSGNILMEMALADDEQSVNAVTSIFGVPSNEEFSRVPSLYILGRNDPVVDFDSRSRFLTDERHQNDDLETLVFSNEGHWIRNEKNLRLAVHKIVGFYREHD